LNVSFFNIGTSAGTETDKKLQQIVDCESYTAGLTSQNGRHQCGVGQIDDANQQITTVRDTFGCIAATVAEEETNQKGAEYVNEQLQVGHALE